jgi:predicted signal transduction protein with EAL and GGDEF domain
MILGLKIKIALAAIALLAVGYVVWDYSSLRSRNAQLSSQVATLTEQKNKLVEEKRLLNIDLDNQRVLNIKLNGQLLASREQMNRMVVLFSDHDFQKLIEKKPGLITIRMQKATEKVFREIEEASKQ